MNKSIINLMALLFLQVMLLNCQSNNTKGIQFKKGKWEEIKRKAEKQNKLIFVDIYTTWCGPCKKMDKSVFTDKKLGDYFNKNFLNYKIDAEKGEGIALAKEYKVKSFPNLLFINAKGQLVERKGYMNIDELLTFGKQIEISDKKLASMNNTYEKGDRSYSFILKYLSFLKAKDLQTQNVVISYLETLDKKEWFLDKNLFLMKYYLNTPYNPAVDYVLKYRNEMIERGVSEPGELKLNFYISLVIDKVFFKYLDGFIMNKGSDTDEKVFKLLNHASLKLKEEEFFNLNFRSNVLSSKRDGDWIAYQKHISNFINRKTLEDHNPLTLNRYAWAFYKNVPDLPALEEAITWINIALKKSPNNYYYLDTKGALLYKLGKKNEAIKYLNKAIKVADTSEIDASSTKKMLANINIQ